MSGPLVTPERDRAELRGAKTKFAVEQYQLAEERGKLDRDRALASTFVRAYEAVPEAERTPPFAAALKLRGLLVQASRAAPGQTTGSKRPITVDLAQVETFKKAGLET